MKKQIAIVLITGAVVLTALLAWANAAGPSEELFARVVGAVLIVGLLLAVQLIKRTHQRKTLEQVEGSFERSASLKAQSGAYIDALVISILALAVVSIFGHSLLASVVMLGASILFILSFWARYLMAKRAVLVETVDEESHR